MFPADVDTAVIYIQRMAKNKLISINKLMNYTETTNLFLLLFLALIIFAFAAWIFFQSSLEGRTIYSKVSCQTAFKVFHQIDLQEFNNKVKKPYSSVMTIQ